MTDPFANDKACPHCKRMINSKSGFALHLRQRRLTGRCRLEPTERGTVRYMNPDGSIVTARELQTARELKKAPAPTASVPVADPRRDAFAVAAMKVLLMRYGVSEDGTMLASFTVEYVDALIARLDAPRKP